MSNVFFHSTLGRIMKWGQWAPNQLKADLALSVWGVNSSPKFVLKIPPPPGPQIIPPGPQIRPSGPEISPPRPQISPPRPQLSPQGLKSALLALNLPPPCLKSTLQTSHLPFRYAPSGLNLPSKSWNMPPQDGRTDGRLEIPPCFLQDIGPLGPLPCSIIARAIDILVLDQLIIEQKSNCSLTLLVVLALFV